MAPRMLRTDWLLHGALACAAAVGLLAALALNVPALRAGDLSALRDFVSLRHGTPAAISRVGVQMCEPISYAVLSALVVGIALVRRRWKTAVVVAALLLAAPLCTEALKHLLSTPRPDAWPAMSISDHSFPSGHTTAAATLAIAAVLAAPARLRPLVAVLGALFAAWEAASILVLAWHFPSDVVAGLLVAAACGALAAAADRAPLRRRPVR